MRFGQLVEQVEAQTPYRFYFNPADIDSLTVVAGALSQGLPAVLHQALSATQLRFAIDEQAKRVFITRGQALQTELPTRFFEGGVVGEVPPTADELVADAGPAGRAGRVSTSELRCTRLGRARLRCRPAGGWPSRARCAWPAPASRPWAWRCTSSRPTSARLPTRTGTTR